MEKMEEGVKTNKGLGTMLEESIDSFYSFEHTCIERIKEYPKYKRYLLYPVTIMNGNVLGILTSITTCLSMNIFTSFISFQSGTFFDLIIWTLRFIFAIMFNICIVRLSIMCTILKDKDIENRNNGIMRAERLVDRLNEYDSAYNKIRKEVVWGIVSMMVLFTLIIIFPIGRFFIINRANIGAFIHSAKLYFDELILYLKSFN